MCHFNSTPGTGRTPLPNFCCLGEYLCLCVCVCVYVGGVTHENDWSAVVKAKSLFYFS